jgi:hypothetical protein
MLSLLFGPMKFTNKLVILSTVIALIILRLPLANILLLKEKKKLMLGFQTLTISKNSTAMVNSLLVLHAHGIDIDSSGNVYVVDSGNVHEKKDVCALQFFTSSCLYLKDNLVLILIIQDKKHFI